MRTYYRWALALTMVIVTAEAAHAQTTLKMNIAIAQNSHYGVAIDTFAREVEKRTNGRYKIQNFYAATTRMRVRYSTVRSGRICSPNSMRKASRRWRGARTASAT